MASYDNPAPTDRNAALIRWRQLQRDNEFLADFMAGKSSALKAKQDVDAALASSGGAPSGSDLKIVGDGFDDAAQRLETELFGRTQGGQT